MFIQKNPEAFFNLQKQVVNLLEVKHNSQNGDLFEVKIPKVTE